MSEQIIIFGKNLEKLKGYPDNYFDSIVTDSPYGLGEEPDANEVLKDWLEKGVHEVKSKGGFMGKEWDAFVPQPLFWKECYRVLKPGGYLLSFFGTRTYDWGTMAIRLAGFEIRNQIQWLYATGFPKSLDISKQIDKQAGADRPFAGYKVEPNGRTMYNESDLPRVCNPTEKTDRKFGADNRTISDRKIITNPATDEAKEWDGWGTDLKPANEPIVVARKPLSEKTVVANILKHGTGGINIDACRIGTDVIETNGGEKFKGDGIFNKYDKEFEGSSHIGRFPANIILGCPCETEEHEEGCPVKELDRQSGVTTSSGGSGEKSMGGMGKNGIYGEFALDKLAANAGGLGDTGGASRFFFVAKPSDWERQRGLNKFVAKDPASVTDFRPTLKSNPENWANGTETPYTRTTPKKNNHPTVKPVELMRYLVRLVTQKEGICLDPFNGSGTTGIACKLEGINYVGIEQDDYNCQVSEARIKVWTNTDQQNLFEI